MINSKRGLDFDWTKVDAKFKPLIDSLADAEGVVDLDDSELTQMQRNFVCTANTYFIEDLLRELTTHPEEIETGEHPLFIRQEKDLRDKAIAEGPDYVIKNIKTAGKWMEFWFSGNEKWDECCKQYMLYEVMDKAGLDGYILSHGFVGLIVTWPNGSDRPTAIRKSEPEQAGDDVGHAEDLMRELATNPDSIEDGSHSVFKQLERDTFPYCLARNKQLQRCRRLMDHDGECRFKGFEETTKH